MGLRVFYFGGIIFMSQNLFWEPKATCLSKELKWAIEKKFDLSYRVVLTFGDINYLWGLRDAGIEDAQKLIDAIEKYNEIEIWRE